MRVLRNLEFVLVVNVVCAVVIYEYVSSFVADCQVLYVVGGEVEAEYFISGEHSSMDFHVWCIAVLVLIEC